METIGFIHYQAQMMNQGRAKGAAAETSQRRGLGPTREQAGQRDAVPGTARHGTPAACSSTRGVTRGQFLQAKEEAYTLSGHLCHSHPAHGQLPVPHSPRDEPERRVGKQRRPVIQAPGRAGTSTVSSAELSYYLL